MLFVQSYHVADEYFQGIEPAYFNSFNNRGSKIELTWEWKKDVALRSPIYLGFMIVSFLLCQDSILIEFSNYLEYPGGSLVLSSRICHALLSTFVEWKLYLFLKNKFKFNLTKFATTNITGTANIENTKSREKMANYYYYFTVTNWFWYYNCSRTLANSLELMLNCLALILFLEGLDKFYDCMKFNKIYLEKYKNYNEFYFWRPEPYNVELPESDSEDEEDNRQDQKLKNINDQPIKITQFFKYIYSSPLYLLIVGFSTAIRPTAIVPWLTLYLKELAILYRIGSDMSEIEEKRQIYYDFRRKYFSEGDFEDDENFSYLPKSERCKLLAEKPTKKNNGKSPSILSKIKTPKFILSFHVFNTFFITLFILSSSFCFDSIYYNKNTSTVFNFLTFNFLTNNADLYGTSSVFWVLLDGIWTVYGLVPLIFLLLIGHISSNEKKESADKSKSQSLLEKLADTFGEFLRISCNFDPYGLFACWFVGLLLFSIPGHKEHRFIMPMMPFIVIYLSMLLVSLSESRENQITSKKASYSLKPLFKNHKLKFKIFITFNTLLNIFLAYYFSRIHQTGPIKVTKFFRKILLNYSSYQISSKNYQDQMEHKLKNLKIFNHSSSALNNFYNFKSNFDSSGHAHYKSAFSDATVAYFNSLDKSLGSSFEDLGYYKFKRKYGDLQQQRQYAAAARNFEDEVTDFNLETIEASGSDDYSIEQQHLRPVVIYSLLPCHSLPGYGYYSDIDHPIIFNQLECPPHLHRQFKIQKKYQQTGSSPNPEVEITYKHLYNDGNLPIPPISELENFKIHIKSDFLVIYEKDAENYKIWLHKNAFRKKKCFFHTHMPLGEEHDKYMCVYEKEVRIFIE